MINYYYELSIRNGLALGDFLRSGEAATGVNRKRVSLRTTFYSLTITLDHLVKLPRETVM